MSQQQFFYNQIDFVVKAPRFSIVFSYVDDRSVSFVREYMLRLLKLIPCKPEQIAQYFGFSKYETEVALADLENNGWIVWQENGVIALSTKGVLLFSTKEENVPKIPTLKEFKGEYRMELLDNNFLRRGDCISFFQNAIELDIDPKVLSESKEIARKVFQSRFVQLMEDDIIGLDIKDASLYKIDVVEPKGRPDYFRFCQTFELLPQTGEAKERQDIVLLTHQDHIQQAITNKLSQLIGSSNLQDLMKSMDAIQDEHTVELLSNGRLDVDEFFRTYQQYNGKDKEYFIGQIYHHDVFFEQVRSILDRLRESDTRKFYWIAPSDVYWGKQSRIYDRINFLGNNQKTKKYNFRLYLPISPERRSQDIHEWSKEFREIQDKILYGFKEGFLYGNTEILFLEGKFAIVCYHAKLEAYPVSFPIGFMTKNKEEVTRIQQLVERYLSGVSYLDGYRPYHNDFGKLSEANS